MKLNDKQKEYIANELTTCALILDRLDKFFDSKIKDYVEEENPDFALLKHRVSKAKDQLVLSMLELDENKYCDMVDMMHVNFEIKL